MSNTTIETRAYTSAQRTILTPRAAPSSPRKGPKEPKPEKDFRALYLVQALGLAIAGVVVSSVVRQGLKGRLVNPKQFKMSDFGSHQLGSKRTVLKGRVAIASNLPAFVAPSEANNNNSGPSSFENPLIKRSFYIEAYTSQGLVLLSRDQLEAGDGHFTLQGIPYSYLTTYTVFLKVGDSEGGFDPQWFRIDIPAGRFRETFQVGELTIKAN